MNAPAWLADHRADTFSQSGEDGVVAKILEILPKDDKWCVEFGAHDGVHLSNTRNLIVNHGYRAVLIEPDRTRFEKLRTRYSAEPLVMTLNAFVGFSPSDNLDHLLETTGVPLDFSFLSIDIDGNDYHAWEAISKYRPRVVCIEFNPTIPTEVNFVQAADPSVMHGSSLRAMFELGRRKGYELVSVLAVNAIFVRRDYYPLFDIEDNDPAALRIDVSDVTYMFSGFDGTIFLLGCRMLPWHQIDLDERRFQRLPKIIRRYPTRYGLARGIFYMLYLLWSDPSVFARKLRAKLNRFRSGSGKSDPAV